MKKLALLVLIFTNSFTLQPSNQPPVQQPQFLQQYPGMHNYYKQSKIKQISKLKIVGISVGASVVTATLVATVISFVMCKVRL